MLEGKVYRLLIKKGVETLSKQKCKEAESLLIDYLSGNLHEQLEERKLELRFPKKKNSKSDLRDKAIDPKVFSNDFHSTVEQDVLTYVDDGTYTFLSAQIRRIEKCLKHIRLQDELDYRILVMFYKQKKSWVCIAHKVHLSESQCRRRRNKSIKELIKWI